MIQITCFLLVWEAACHVSEALGRGMHSDLFFGHTVYYGSLILSALFLISSATMTYSKTLVIKWAVTGTSAILWFIWTSPAFGSYPIRGLTFFSIGFFILISGSLFINPWLNSGFKSLSSESICGS